jgi:hypothetical protein
MDNVGTQMIKNAIIIFKSVLFVNVAPQSTDWN